MPLLYNEKVSKIFPTKIQDLKDEVGIEIECEGNNLLHEGILSYWNISKDGSLRGNDSAEYILKKPVPREKVLMVLEYLEKKLKEHKAKVEKSDRTSVHVHLNVQGETIRKVVQIVTYWMILENLMVAYCGESRVSNLFCLRASDAEGHWRALRRAVKTNDYNELRRDDYRYASLNLASLQKYGSIEFRCFKGTTKPWEIHNWVQMLLELKDEAVKFKSPQEIIAQFSRMGADDFLSKTPFIEEQLQRFAHKPKIMYEGVRNAQDVAFCIPEWEEPGVLKNDVELKQPPPNQEFGEDFIEGRPLRHQWDQRARAWVEPRHVQAAGGDLNLARLIAEREAGHMQGFNPIRRAPDEQN